MKQLWRKSSHSGTHNCVEVARACNEVAIRDSKMALGSPTDIHLGLTADQFDSFLSALRKGTLRARRLRPT